MTDAGRIISAETLEIVGYMNDNENKDYYWYESSPNSPHNIYVLEEDEMHIKVYRLVFGLTTLTTIFDTIYI